MSNLPASPMQRRMIAGAIALVCAAVLGVAAWMSPSAEGLGTHEQLRMPSCGWIATMDMPCPTCGMTTSFAHAADGNLLASFLTQPFGCVLAIVTAMTLILSLYVVATGVRVWPAIAKCCTPSMKWWVGVFAVAAWGYKILSYKGML